MLSENTLEPPVALLKEAALGRGQGVMEVSVGKGKKGEL
jgi:hypothetical protein